MNKRIIWTTAILALIATAWGIAQDTPGIAGPISAALLGTNSSGKAIAITLGTNLSLAGTTLNAAGSGGATHHWIGSGVENAAGNLVQSGFSISTSLSSLCNVTDPLPCYLGFTNTTIPAAIYTNFMANTGYAGVTVTMTVIAFTSAAGNFKFTTDIGCKSVGDDLLSPSYGGAVSVQTINNTSGTLPIQTVSFTNINQCTAGQMVFVRIQRVAATASEYGNTVGLIGADLLY